MTDSVPVQLFSSREKSRDLYAHLLWMEASARRLEFGTLALQTKISVFIYLLRAAAYPLLRRRFEQYQRDQTGAATDRSAPGTLDPQVWRSMIADPLFFNELVRKINGQPHDTRKYPDAYFDDYLQLPSAHFSMEGAFLTGAEAGLYAIDVEQLMAALKVVSADPGAESVLARESGDPGRIAVLEALLKEILEISELRENYRGRLTLSTLQAYQHAALNHQDAWRLYRPQDRWFRVLDDALTAQLRALFADQTYDKDLKLSLGVALFLSPSLVQELDVWSRQYRPFDGRYDVNTDFDDLLVLDDSEFRDRLAALQEVGSLEDTQRHPQLHARLMQKLLQRHPVYFLLSLIALEPHDPRVHENTSSAHLDRRRITKTQMVNSLDPTLEACDEQWRSLAAQLIETLSLDLGNLSFYREKPKSRACLLEFARTYVHEARRANKMVKLTSFHNAYKHSRMDLESDLNWTRAAQRQQAQLHATYRALHLTRLRPSRGTTVPQE